ncbi:MAG: outer membrane protein assembly factor BamA [Pseudomonadota bacterium]
MIGATRTAVLLVVWLMLHVPFAAAQTQTAQSILSGGTIEEIRVEGTQRIEPATVQSYMQIDPGDPFDPLKLNDALKNLFATQLFSDVTLQREGSTLIVSVVENPIINRIAFEGNDKIDDEVLETEIELKPRIVFTQTKAQNDVQRLINLYQRQGRFGATIEPKVIQLPQNRVDLVFEISEGPTTKIKSINFIGNREFSDGRLRDEIATSESAFWKFFTSTDSYDPDRLTFDRELLRRFYLSEGYADFLVISAVAELTPDKEGFIITFTVEEGERYKFGTIDLNTTLKDLDPEVLREDLLTEEGEWYDASAVEESVANLTERLNNLGYAFVDIRPNTDRDRENLTINLVYEINEGPKVYVERIDIQGNVRTIDKVIRREFRFVEGDAFNSAKIRRTRTRINDLGFFSSVEITNEPGTEPDKTIVTVDVQEQSTGSLTFGAGFSTNSGPLGNVGIRERNLLGRGQDLLLSFTLGGDLSELELSFTEPYFLDRNLSAGVDLFWTTNEQDESSFDERRLGGSLRAGYDLTENIRQVWRYTLEEVDIDNVDDDASLVVQLDQGKRLESVISHELFYDTRDSRFDPRSGFILSTLNEFAGLGGDVTYLRNTIGGGYYYTIFGDVTAGLRGEVGNIFGIGEDTLVSDRFFLGQDQLRGFEFAGVSPRDAVTDDALGGKNFYTGTVEVSFPVGLPDEFQIRGRLFSDIGAAWDIDDVPASVIVEDSSSPRLVIGAGFSWVSPFGPVIVDLGFPVVKEDFDKEEILSFSFGTRF